MYLALKVSLFSGVFTKLANLPIVRNERMKNRKNNRKMEFYLKYELEVTYECRKLGSLGRLFEGQVIFFF